MSDRFGSGTIRQEIMSLVRMDIMNLTFISHRRHFLESCQAQWKEDC